MSNATGTFAIASMSEDAYHETQDGVKLTRASGTQRFTGGIEADGSVEWLMCYLPDGSATFVGLQRIEGSIDGRGGSFVMEAIGTHDGEQSKASWTVIAGSGTGRLEGIAGEGSFHAPSGPRASYDLEYRLP